MIEPRVPVEVDTLLDLLELRASTEHQGRRDGLILLDEYERSWPVSYSMLLERSRRIAQGLQKRGLREHERVAVMLPNGLEFVATFFGTLLAGGIPVPVSPPFFLNDVSDFLSRFEGIASNCQPSFLVTFKDIRWLAAGAARVTPSVRGVLLPESLGEDASSFRRARRSAGDTCFLQYTSGSTGRPKGVEISHRNVLSNAYGIGAMSEARDDDVCVTWLPLYHDMGLIGALLTSIYWGVPLVLMSPLVFIKSPVRWLRAIHRFQGTCSPAPNFAYRVCLKIPDKDLAGLDLSSWRIAYNGAERVDIETLRQFIDKFGRLGFSPRAPLPVYGLAEATLAVTHPALDAPLDVDVVDGSALSGEGGEYGVARPSEEGPGSVQVVSVGRPLPNTEVRIADAEGRERVERETGEIWVRGHAVMKGYFRDRHATKAAMRDGWLATGDVGYMVSGKLFVTGRRKDLLIKAGHNYYPQDVEDAVRGLDGVRRGGVAALGVFDRQLGSERVVLVVETLRMNDEGVRRDLIRRIRSAVATAVGLSLDEIELVPPHTILRTSSGKIRRKETRDLYLKGDLLRRRNHARIPLLIAIARSFWQLGLFRIRQVWRRARVARSAPLS